MSVLLVSVLLWGQTAPTPVEDARALIDKLEYSRGLEVLEEALEGGELDVAQKVTAHSLAAVAHSARGEPELAERAYFRALRLDPKFALPSGMSPKMAHAFERAQSRFRAARPSGLVVEARADERRVAIEGRFVDPEDIVLRVTINRHFRDAEAPPEQSTPTVERRGDRRSFRASIARREGEDSVALDLSLDSASRDPLVRWGSPDAPKLVDFPTSPALYERWWFWTAVGVGVAGIAVTATVLATRDDLLGRIEVP